MAYRIIEGSWIGQLERKSTRFGPTTFFINAYTDITSKRCDSLYSFDSMTSECFMRRWIKKKEKKKKRKRLFFHRNIRRKFVASQYIFQYYSQIVLTDFFLSSFFSVGFIPDKDKFCKIAWFWPIAKASEKIVN